MKTNVKKIVATCAVAITLAAWAIPGLAVAPLEGRTINGERVDAYDSSAVMIYDPNADLTWLRNWNVNGTKSWLDQLIWVSNLQVGRFANWSLPTARNQDGSGPCGGFDCTGSQFGYLWYVVLGNSTGSFTNKGPFQNAMSDIYWTGTLAASDASAAYVFWTVDGSQGPAPTFAELYAVAVRAGDVATPVPEPQTWATLILGLGLTSLVLKKRAPKNLESPSRRRD